MGPVHTGSLHETRGRFAELPRLDLRLLPHLPALPPVVSRRYARGQVPLMSIAYVFPSRGRQCCAYTDVG